MITRYRSWAAVGTGWLLIALAVFGLFVAMQSGFSFVALLIALGVIAFAWFIAIRPAVIVYEEALIIQNVLSRHEIDWSSISYIRPTLLLTVVTEDGRKISAWAISSSARPVREGNERRADVIAMELEAYRVAYGTRGPRH